MVDPYEIHVLKCATDSTDLLVELSLRPLETISAALSKLKGRISKWLNEPTEVKGPTLSNGYFACTVGKSKKDVVDRYLDGQSEHHGYSRRVNAPVLVTSYELIEEEKERITPKHAVVTSQFHIVLATRSRKGVFGSHSGSCVVKEWLALQREMRFALLKNSFAPDHVHIALRAHPTVSPGNIACALMNRSQIVMRNEMASIGINQLWQPSAYIGAYGDMGSAQIRKYIGNWSDRA